MAKKSSSRRWMNEHLNDEYVKKAQKEGYRCRAVYKLIEIIDKNQIITKGDRILDLGAAPGGWSQVAAKIVGKTGQIIASDILPIEEITGVDFLQGDFTEMSVYKALLSLTKDQKMNTILSDMAPNMSGQLSVDQPKSRSEEHTSELQSRHNIVCRLLLEKKKKMSKQYTTYRTQTSSI